jgi:hypothetical protein
MTRIRCNSCNTELEVTQPNKSKACGCDNQTLLRLDRDSMPVISGIDLSLIVSIDGVSKPKVKGVDNLDVSPYTPKRIPRKMEFETR